MPIDLDWVLDARIRDVMELVHNGGNVGDSGSPFAILNADIGKLDDRLAALEAHISGLDVRIEKLEIRVDTLVLDAREARERVVRVETSNEFLRLDIENCIHRRLDAGITARKFAGAIIAVALFLAALLAKGFGWL